MRIPVWAMLLIPVVLAGDASPVLPDLALPIEGMRVTDLRDMFAEEHNGHPHEAIDIMTRKGTPVHAVVTGTIQKLFLSKAGGITIYQFDRDQVYCYYYAHLERYADGLEEGMHVERGEVVGYADSTGNASPLAPHLHFAIFELGPEKHWWKGKAINPYPALVAAVRRQQ